MATRREIQQRREHLQQVLRERCCSQGMNSGEIIPPLRDLALQHGLSVPVVRQAVSGLVAEGLLYARPGVGTMIGRPFSVASELFLLLVPDGLGDNAHLKAIQSGFEERLSQMGASSIKLDYATARSHLAHGGLPPLSGVFHFREDSNYSGSKNIAWLHEGTRVEFGKPQTGTVADSVYFDNVNGGRQATEHLLRQGHGGIAFLALHVRDDDPGAFLWSKERETGWRARLDESDRHTAIFAFHPSRKSGFQPEEQVENAREAAVALVNRRDVTAVVAANEHTAQGLFLALRDADIPGDRWPAVVCFDEFEEGVVGGANIVTTLRQPWDHLGREAAELLWQRHHGKLPAAPQRRLVPMRLISRLTCRPAWSQSNNMASLVAATG